MDGLLRPWKWAELAWRNVLETLEDEAEKQKKEEEEKQVAGTEEKP